MKRSLVTWQALGCSLKRRVKEGGEVCRDHINGVTEWYSHSPSRAGKRHNKNEGELPNGVRGEDTPLLTIPPKD